MTERLLHDEIELRQVKLAFDSISVYRRLLKDRTISKLYALVDYLVGGNNELSSFISLYSDFFYSLACNSGGSVKDHIIDSIIFDENPYSQKVECLDSQYQSVLLEAAVSNDLNCLQTIADICPNHIKSCAVKRFCKLEFENSVVNNLPEWDNDKNFECNIDHSSSEWMRNRLKEGSKWSECLGDLAKFYKNQGSGVFARYKAFIWEHSGSQGCLKTVDTPDPVKLSDLIGYELERSKVVDNTIQFINGYPANNVLLYGDRGTGKSSTVKALLNEYHSQGLRIIEVPKAYLVDFQEIIRSLRGRPQKFIVFVDDLSFEDNEESYTALKAVLEGGIESKPANVAIYATSNRRHLIKEKFADRAGLQSGNLDEEVHAADSIQEKLSLADRFGITVVFSSPDKNRYLKIVEGLASKRGLTVNKEQLHSEALKWEIWYNGRSPRTARQFVDWLEGQVGR